VLPREPAPTTAPVWVSGAWWRTRLVIDGRVVRHPGPALWLQDGDCYVDLRGPGPSPLDGPRVFAGTTAWSAPYLRWFHEADSVPGRHDDVGRLARRGDVALVESGVVRTATGTVPYRERWERVAGEGRVTVRRVGDGFLARAEVPLPLELRVGGGMRRRRRATLDPAAGPRASGQGWDAPDAGDPELVDELPASPGASGAREPSPPSGGSEPPPHPDGSEPPPHPHVLQPSSAHDPTVRPWSVEPLGRSVFRPQFREIP
jgi:hypothetical protein